MKNNSSSWQSFMENHVNWILFIAAIAITIFMVNDTHIMQNVIKSTDPFSAVMAYLTVGGWVGLILNWLLCQTPIGKVIDPTFDKLTFMNLKSQVSAIVVGAIGALSTLFLLWGSQLLDPSLVVPLGNLSIVFVFLYEIITRKISWKKAWLSVFLVVLGAMVFTFNPTSGAFISLTGILVLAVFKNLVSSVGEVLEQEGVISGNATSFGFWRFFWLTMVATVLAITMSLARGHFGDYLGALGLALGGFGWILMTMFFVFFGIGLKNAAKKYTEVSKVMMFMSLPVILALPATVLIDSLWPGTFGVQLDAATITLRFVGALLILIGLWKTKDI